MRKYRSVVLVCLSIVLGFFAVATEIAIGSGKTSMFENRFLRVTLGSVSAPKDGGFLALTLRFENISDREIRIAFIADPKSVYLLDDKGGMWVLENKPVGLETVVHSGMPMSLFTPKQSAPVLMRFKPTQPSDGKAFSFAANMYAEIDHKQDRFSIGLESIRLP